MNKKCVAGIGATGQIGTSLTRGLLKAGHAVTIMTCKRSLSNEPNLAGYEDSGAKVVVGKDTEASPHETVHLVLLPLPCYFRKIATEGLEKAPSHLKLPELPMYSLALITDEQPENDARDVFISYLEAELDNLERPS